MKTIGLIFLLGFSSAVVAADVYIKSLKAPMLKEAKNGSEIVQNFERGAKLNSLGNDGSFVKVESGGKTGFVNKLFVSDKAPEGSGGLLNQNADISSDARKSGSAINPAAAARGIAPSTGKSLLNNDVDISSGARKRASGFTSAAAARGLKEDSDDIFKTLGTDVNGEELKKMESFKVNADVAFEFITQDNQRLSE